MSKISNKCRRCGYELESNAVELCLPCTARFAIEVMRGTSVTSTPMFEATYANNEVPECLDIKSPALTHNSKLKGGALTGGEKLNSKNRPSRSIMDFSRPRAAMPESSRKKNNQPNKKMLNCILCGAKIEDGQLLKHKSEVHGEKTEVKNNNPRRISNSWVVVVNGGLPTLGRRR